MRTESEGRLARFGGPGEVDTVGLETHRPVRLGSLARSLAVVATLLGLATFPLQLITTAAPVLGEMRWSPLELLAGIMAGALPTSAMGHLTLWVSLAAFGFVFVYLALVAILLAVVVRPSSRFVLITALLAASVITEDIFLHFASFQRALCGSYSPAACGQAIHAGLWSAMLLSVMGVLVAIAGLETIAAKVLMTEPAQIRS